MKRLLKVLKPAHAVLHFLEKKPALAWILVGAYMVMIFYFSSLENPLPNFIPDIPSFVEHMAEYAVFGFLLLAAFRSNEATKESAWLFAIAAASVYGITDEIHQLFVQGRVASIIDWTADTMGASITSIVNLQMKNVERRI